MQSVASFRYYAVFLAYATVWWLIPLLLNPNPPLDMLEAAFWSHNWQWGYYKTPPLQIWLQGSFTFLFGSRDWAIATISGLWSMPTTTPRRCRVRNPVPHATSRTRSPGLSAASSIRSAANGPPIAGPK